MLSTKLIPAVLLLALLDRFSSSCVSEDECSIADLRISKSPSLVQGQYVPRRVKESLDSPVGDALNSALNIQRDVEAQIPSFAQISHLSVVGRVKAHGRLLATLFFIAAVLICSGACFALYASTHSQKQGHQSLRGNAGKQTQSFLGSSPQSPVPSANHGKRGQSAATTSACATAAGLAQSNTSNPSICPELIVPEGNECSLLLPRLPPMGAGNSGHVSVDDSSGVPIFQAQFDCDPRQKSNARLLVGSANSQAVYATCRDAADEGGGLMIHNAEDQLLGVLRADNMDRSSYHLLTRTGVRINFRGDIRSGAITITDHQGRLMANADGHRMMDGGRRCVRVGPLVDAGLVVVNILGIDIIEHSARELRK